MSHESRSNLYMSHKGSGKSGSACVAVIYPSGNLQDGSIAHLRASMGSPRCRGLACGSDLCNPYLGDAC
jgi:hypothetical protein